MTISVKRPYEDKPLELPGRDYTLSILGGKDAKSYEIAGFTRYAAARRISKKTGLRIAVRDIVFVKISPRGQLHIVLASFYTTRKDAERFTSEFRRQMAENSPS